MIGDLQRLAAAESVYYAVHHTFTADVALLRIPDDALYYVGEDPCICPLPGILINIEHADSSGWWATAQVEGEPCIRTVQGTAPPQARPALRALSARCEKPWYQR